MWNYGAIHPLAHNVIRYNISENDGRKHHYAGIGVGTLGTPVEDVEVYNNSIFTAPSSTGTPVVVWVGGRAANRAIRFRNNLLISEASVPLVEIEPNQQDVRFEGNAYWARSGNFLFLDRGKTYHGLDEWRKATGQEQLAGRSTDIATAPRLTSLGDGQTMAAKASLSTLQSYRLLPDSPLIDAGLDLPAEFGIDVGTRDFWGTPIPQGQRFDIGACEAPTGNPQPSDRSNKSQFMMQLLQLCTLGRAARRRVLPPRKPVSAAVCIAAAPCRGASLTAPSSRRHPARLASGAPGIGPGSGPQADRTPRRRRQAQAVRGRPLRLPARCRSFASAPRRPPDPGTAERTCG